MAAEGTTSTVPDFNDPVRSDVGDGSITPGWAAAGAAALGFLLGLPELTIALIAASVWVAWEFVQSLVRTVKSAAASAGLSLNDAQSYVVLLLLVYGIYREAKS